MNRVGTAAIAVRLVIVAMVVALLALAPYTPWFAVAVMLFGLAQSVVWPGQAGVLFTGLGVLLAWTFGGGLHAHPSAVAAIASAAALYVLHVATTLAAFVPFGAVVDASAWRAPVRRAVPVVVVSAVFVALDYGLGERRGDAAYEAAGIVAVVVVAAGVTVRALGRRV